jgi:hypothetical protein
MHVLVDQSTSTIHLFLSNKHLQLASENKEEEKKTKNCYKRLVIMKEKACIGAWGEHM